MDVFYKQANGSSPFRGIGKGKDRVHMKIADERWRSQVNIIHYEEDKRKC